MNIFFFPHKMMLLILLLPLPLVTSLAATSILPSPSNSTLGAPCFCLQVMKELVSQGCEKLSDFALDCGEASPACEGAGFLFCEVIDALGSSEIEGIDSQICNQFGFSCASATLTFNPT